MDDLPKLTQDPLIRSRAMSKMQDLMIISYGKREKEKLKKEQKEGYWMNIDITRAFDF